jgi:hypothetical protein
LKDCAISTSTWRAMVKVMRACSGGSSRIPTSTRAQQSITQASAESQDWLWCWER